MTDIRKKLEELGLTEIAEAAGLDASSATARDVDDQGIKFTTFRDQNLVSLSWFPVSSNVVTPLRAGGCTVDLHGSREAVLAMLLKLKSLEEGAND